MKYYSIGEFANKIGKTIQTLRNWDKSCSLKPHHITKAGTRYYSQEQLNHFLGLKPQDKLNKKTIGYCRVSSYKQKDGLERQIENVKTYMYAKGYQFEIISDIGSGINYNKKGLNKLLDMVTNSEVDKIVVLYKDRLIRFGYELIENLCEKYGTAIEIIDNTEKTEDQELVEDLIQIVTVFSCRLQGRRAEKARLYPSELQEQKLWQSVGTARFIYNWTLARQEENYKNGGKFISDKVLRKELTQLKKSELSWLNEVSNNVSKQAVKDACNAYKRFFKGLSGKPKFKSKRKGKKSFYNDNIKLKVKESKLVSIEKIGWIKTNEQLPAGVKYSNPRINYDNKYWYISVGAEQEEIKEDLTDISLGVDLGLKNLAICSSGTVYKNINKTYTVRKIEKRLKKLQRQVSRKYEQNKKGKEYVKTKNIIKLEKQIQQVDRRLANIRNNYLHQTTTSIVKTKPYRVVIEDLNVKGMMKNKHLSDAIRKQGFYEFRRQLGYKCKFRGIELVVADRFYPSSKTCSQCGKINKDLKLKDRVYSCSCGLSIDRDLNACINLPRYKLA